MRPIASLTVVAALATISAAAAGEHQIYRWVGSDGIVHYSDQKPDDGIRATTMAVSSDVPNEYDPADDPYSILNQASRLDEALLALEEARETRQQKRLDEAARHDRETSSQMYDPYVDYYARAPAVYYFHPTRRTQGFHRPKAALRQHGSLAALDLLGPRSHSINSGLHRARVARSAGLPLAAPKRLPR